MSHSEAILRHTDRGYPRRLAGVAGAPEVLHVRGALGDAEHSVAIVGARAATCEAVETARSLARALARGGACVVSGGALGVDAAAHAGALDAHRETGRGTTVAVLGCGIDVVYPLRHRRLYQDICAAGGAVVSEFAHDAPPRPGHFVRRNRTIAALADAVVVVQAGARSGALHTARAGRALGRLVAAVPGSPGCERLLAQGAAPIEQPGDLWDALAGRPGRPRAALPDPGSDAARVLASLDPERGQACGELASLAGMSARQVARALTGLELEGLAVAGPGRNYVRSALAEELLAS